MAGPRELHPTCHKNAGKMAGPRNLNPTCHKNAGKMAGPYESRPGAEAAECPRSVAEGGGMPLGKVSIAIVGN